MSNNPVLLNISSKPVFQSPEQDPASAFGRYGLWASRAQVFQGDTALESMRDSGFDLTAAAGEPIDNSVEAICRSVSIPCTFSPEQEPSETETSRLRNERNST